MSNVFFPVLDGQSRPIQLKVTARQPQFVTDVQRSLGGSEFRVGRVAYPRWRFSISIPVLPDGSRDDALGTIMAFFIARMGQLDSFLFAPPDGANAIANFGSGGWNRLTGVQIGIGDGTQRTFTLVRPYGGGSWPYAASEPIQWLDTRNNALVVRDAGSVVSGVTTATSGGVVTVMLPFAPITGHAVTADFDYAYRVRFAVDAAKVDWLAWQLYKGFAVELEQVFE